MAKYSRYDTRNKKRDNHKIQSIEKDIRIREVITYDKLNPSMLREVVYNNDEQINDEPQFLRE
jgi:hypothetical protein|tara:strand:+ start:2526 stop:2714 length:189 start_codon:yes stop_codon:yes gene_type:complete